MVTVLFWVQLYVIQLTLMLLQFEKDSVAF